MRALLINLSLLTGLLWLSTGAIAAIDVHEFRNDVDRQRYQHFIDELRCPKCQNQNLSGSDSPIAMDLRRELYLMIEEGKSDKEIVDFMVERYGEFILYRPRVTPATLLLWCAPVLLLIAGIILLLLIVRRRRRNDGNNDEQLAADALSVDERARLDALLTNTPPANTPAEKKQ